jgi:catechol 2,3-dioxygenase-like lactoylglutathione lyase family enzyme
VATRKTVVLSAAVTIACTDLKASERFYVEGLGATPDPRDGCGCRWYKLGPLLLSLMHNATAKSPALLPEHAMAMLWVEVDDLESCARRLDRLRAPVLHPSDGNYMMVADPDGIPVEVWQAEE